MMYKLTTLSVLSLLLLMVVAPSYGQDRAQTRKTLDMPPPRPLNLRVSEAPQKVAADTTLKYYRLANGIADFTLRNDFRAIGLFFEAPFDGSIEQVNFEMSNFGNSPGVAGTGQLRVKLVRSPNLVTPASAGVDSLDVDFSQLNARGFVGLPLSNQVDLSSRDFAIAKGEEYFIQFALENASANAALTFVLDPGSTDSTNTDYYDEFGQARTFAFVRENSAPGGVEGYYSFNRNPNIILELLLEKGPPPPPPGNGFLQLVNNAIDAGEIDVYVGNERVADNLDFREATKYFEVQEGTRLITVVDGQDPDNSIPLMSPIPVGITKDQRHVVVAQGRSAEGYQLTFKNVQAAVGGSFSVFSTNGAVPSGPLDFVVLDETEEHNIVQTLADDVEFGQISAPAGLTLGAHNVALTTADNSFQIDVYRLNLNNVPGGPLLLLASGVFNGTPALRLISVDSQGNVVEPAIVTAAEDQADTPSTFALHDNYPNPFNPTTTITFDLEASGLATLKVYDLMGREVATLVDGFLPAQAHQVVFDAAGLPSGPYLYRLESGAFSQQKMLMLVK